MGKKIKFSKNEGGEEYQIAGNFIHLCSKGGAKGRSYRVTFPNSFHFFIDCLLELFQQYREDDEFMYTMEYLVYKLVHNCGRDKRNAKLFNDENGLTRLFMALVSLLGSNTR